MERLTKYAIPKSGRGIPAKRPCFSRGIVKNDCPTFFCYKAKKCEHIKNRECPYLRVMDKLAAYEDAMPLARVQELAQAEKDGRLVVLPCKLGDMVYVIRDEKIIIATVEAIHQWISGKWKLSVCTNRRYTHWVGYEVCFDDFGKTVFLTREEAEAALKKREEGAT